jgi:hypothetical protein
MSHTLSSHVSIYNTIYIHAESSLIPQSICTHCSQETKSNNIFHRHHPGRPTVEDGCPHPEAKADAAIHSHLGTDLPIDADANGCHNMFIIIYRSANINTGENLCPMSFQANPEADAETPIAEDKQFLC